MWNKLLATNSSCRGIYKTEGEAARRQQRLRTSTSVFSGKLVISKTLAETAQHFLEINVRTAGEEWVPPATGRDLNAETKVLTVSLLACDGVWHGAPGVAHPGARSCWLPVAPGCRHPTEAARREIAMCSPRVTWWWAAG